MKLLGRLLLVVLVALTAVELFWFSSNAQQREQWRQHWLLLQWPDLSVNGPLLAQVLFGWRPAENVQQVPSSSDPQAAEQAAQALRTLLQQLQTASSQPPGQQAPGGQSSDMQTEQSPRDIVHSFFSGCYKPPTQDIAQVSSSGVYRWTDDQGRVHFSDKPHEQAQNISDRYRASMQGVKFSFEYPGWKGDASLAQELQREGELQYRILTRFLPRDAWRQINLNVLLFADQASYTAYKEGQGLSQDWGAHYNNGVNRIYMPRTASHEQTLAIGRHEMTHAMLAGMVGTLPVWLNEGLAEYMEGLDWQMSAASVSLNPALLPWLQQAGTQPADVLSLSHDDFSSRDMTTHYRQSAALVYFLLSEAEGQRWLQRTLADYWRSPCSPFNAQRAFASYTGGLNGLYRDYQQWLNRGVISTHRY